VVNFYGSNDSIFGSDHRPVVLSLVLKPGEKEEIEEKKYDDLTPSEEIERRLRDVIEFDSRPRYQYVDLTNIIQKYGVIEVGQLTLANFKLPYQVTAA
jgi:hypothetical protein